MNIEDLHQQVHAALRGWQKVTVSEDDLLADLLIVKQARSELDHDSPAMLRLATNNVLLAALDELAQQDPDSARLLRERFVDNDTLQMVANRLNVSSYSVSRLQFDAIRQLASIIFNREKAVRDKRVQMVESRLQPPTYSRLFGVDKTIDQLYDKLTNSPLAWVLVLVGIGGIGKTAIADAVTRRTIQALEFEEIYWIRLTHQSLSGESVSPEVTFEQFITDLAANILPDGGSNVPKRRLAEVRHVLRTHRYLVVVDNLETMADTAYLLEQLAALVNPSRFLVTTRLKPPAQAIAQTVSITELDEADSIALLKYRAEEIGVTELSMATEADFKAILTVTGGNPLALKLVVSLLDFWTLPQILNDFKDNNLERVGGMYKKIYRQAWQTLSEEARQLLRAMPLVGEPGAETDYLKVISGLSDDALWPALYELQSRSLVEVRGGMREKRYGIHRLTNTFLQTEIIRWFDNGTGDDE